MKRFDSYEDLIKYIGVDSPENIIGLKNVLNRYLECCGSNLMKSKDEERLRYKYKRNEIIDKLFRFLYLLDVILIILYVFILIC